MSSSLNPTAASPMGDRVLALAGIAQALAQVRQIADTGQANAAVLGTALDSVFRIDAESPVAVYGDREALASGLRLLRDYLSGNAGDPQLPRLALAVIQLERRFARNHDMAAKVQHGIRAQDGAAQRLGSTHPEVLSALAALYAQTLSELRPKILVQGNPHYLGQAPVVAEVRAVLLASVRSAVLWRQLGGSLWDLALRRRALAEAVDAQLA